MSAADTTLDTLPIDTLKGVGPRMAGKLRSLGIDSVQDLLFHLPLRYQDRTRITPIGALQAGSDAVIEGTIRAADIVYGKRRSLVCRLQDGTGTITLRFFHFSAAQRQSLQPGDQIRCYGEVRRGATGLELYHPEYRALNVGSALSDTTLTPVYPSSEGLNQVSWRKLTEQALGFLEHHSLLELLPEPPQDVSLQQALRYLHRPPPDAPVSVLREGRHPCQQRLAFEELLAHHLSLLKLRQRTRQFEAPAMTMQTPLCQHFLDTLSFAPTGAQRRVISEIIADLETPAPMLRLVQGDVGSGKTLVAALAALHAIGNGYQVALMAPTEILAEQHLTNFQQWFAALGIDIGWLTGKVKGRRRQQLLDALKTNQLGLLVGTHALFQADVEFHRLGLVIIDEQHRFGVHQRLALKEKGGDAHPHQLVMTATPIPRTLAMSAYADLDTSIIDELPPGRTPVNTAVIDNQRRHQVVERVRNACAEGHQAYWVCTLIEESEQLTAEAAEATAASLGEALPEISIGLIHGRMKPDHKAATMAAFKAGEIQLLVATTVIEVGVDVPNASLMIIENAERLGLSQLHQLRGRVGRGSAASYCVLLYQTPLGNTGKQRLQTMRQFSDGFSIAEQDLALRGPGELLGTRQTGLLQMRIADLQRDAHLLDAVHHSATTLLRDFADRVDPLIVRWLNRAEQFAQV